MVAGMSILALPVSIIGSYFMSEWLDYQRLLLQERIHKSVDLTSMPSKTARIQYLVEQNDTMVNIVSQAQDLLADINPTDAHVRYQQLKRKYLLSIERIGALELELDKLQQQMQQQEQARATLTAALGNKKHPAPVEELANRLEAAMGRPDVQPHEVLLLRRANTLPTRPRSLSDTTASSPFQRALKVINFTPNSRPTSRLSKRARTISSLFKRSNASPTSGTTRINKSMIRRVDVPPENELVASHPLPQDTVSPHDADPFPSPSSTVNEDPRLPT
jgi:hypothetical protein